MSNTAEDLYQILYNALAAEVDEVDVEADELLAEAARAAVPRVWWRVPLRRRVDATTLVWMEVKAQDAETAWDIAVLFCGEKVQNTSAEIVRK